MPSTKIPRGALIFADSTEDVKADKKLNMTVLSGKTIKNHWYWGDLAIDLDGMSLNGTKYPILENHDINKKIAFTGRPIVSGGKLKINPDKTTFVDTPESREFRKLSSKGFPYQASLAGHPTKIERLGPKESAIVNGSKIQGPASIWRKWIFKEASVAVFGWDTKTSSAAFSFRDEYEYLDNLTEESVRLADQITDRQDDMSWSDLSARIAKLEKRQALNAHNKTTFEAQKIIDQVTKNVDPDIVKAVLSEIKIDRFYLGDGLDSIKFEKHLKRKIRDVENHRLVTRMINSLQ